MIANGMFLKLVCLAYAIAQRRSHEIGQLLVSLIHRLIRGSELNNSPIYWAYAVALKSCSDVQRSLDALL